MKHYEYNPFSLREKSILITGASSGIGRQCAIECSKMGASVVLMGRNEERLNQTLSLMQNRQKHLALTLDLVKYVAVEEKVKEIVAGRGKFDGLINCAGVSTTLPLNTLTPGMMEQFFQINVIGAVNLTKQVLKSAHFSDKGGSIIFISSVMGTAGEKGKSVYSMTKGALNAATKSLSLEYAPRKIRINCISPGVVVSPMSQSAVYSRDQKGLDRITELHPLGLGKPEDVANACIFMLSDASRWITGTNIIVDGGYLAR